MFNFHKRNPIIYDIPVKTDMHSHLVPALDDGAQTMEDSINLILEFIKLGYTKLITTPHIMVGVYKNNPSIILQGFDALSKEVKARNIDIVLGVASEYYFDYYFIEEINKKNLMTFGDNYVLVETSTINYPPTFLAALFEMKLNQYKPVLAHAERYTYMWNNKKMYTQFKDMEILFQVNLASLSSTYSPQARKVTEWLIDEKMVEFVGSDAHDKRHFEMINHARTSPYMEKLQKMNLLNDQL